MDKNGKINRGIDLGTTNSAIAVMEHGVPVIKKSSTQRDTLPSMVSVNRKRVIHVGDSAANDYASQVLRSTRTWDGRCAGTDVYKEFKRTMGAKVIYHSRNLNVDFTSQQLSAEIIKQLAVNAGANDGGSIVISVPAKFDANQKTATIEAAHLAGFQHVELLQEPIAAAIAYGVTTGQKEGYWLVFDLGGGTFDAALLLVEGGVQQVVDTEGDSFLGGKDIDYALVDGILLPYVEENYDIHRITASNKKMAMLREALKVYAEAAKVELSTAPAVEVLSDLGDLGCDDTGKEIELDLTITREMAYPIMEPFFRKAVDGCHRLLERNHLDCARLTKLILVGGPTYSPYLRQMLHEEVTPNVDTSIDPMTAVARGAALYAATRDVPSKLQSAPEADVLEVELHYDSMAVGDATFVAVKAKDATAVPVGTTVEVVRCDGAWRSGNVPYEEGGVVVELALSENTVNIFSVFFQDGFGKSIKIFPDCMTVLQGTQVSAAPLPYHVGFGVWDPETERCVFVPFLGLEKNKPLPAVGVAHGRKTTMKLMPGNAETVLRIPVYQAAEYAPLAPASLYEHVADVVITGKDLTKEVPAGSEVMVQVEADSSEVMTFTVSILDTDEEVVKLLDTSPRSGDDEANELIARYQEDARRTLDMLASENVGVEVLKNRLYTLKSNQHHTEKKAVVEMYRELLRDIYRLERDTAWERNVHKVEKNMARLGMIVYRNGDASAKDAFSYLKSYWESAKLNRDVDAAKNLLKEIEYLEDDLMWKTNIPFTIRWYYRNFNNVEWIDKAYARYCINEALALLKKHFSKEELKNALRQIYRAKLRAEEIREAEGLLS